MPIPTSCISSAVPDEPGFVVIAPETEAVKRGERIRWLQFDWSLDSLAAVRDGRIWRSPLRR